MPCHTPWPCTLTPSWSCVSGHVSYVPLSHFDTLIKFAYQKSLQIYLYILISASSPWTGAWKLMGLRPQNDFRNSEFRIRNSKFGIRNSELRIRIQNSEFGIQNSEFGIVNSNGNRFAGP